ncbi:MAG: aquaporin [Pseudomonadota bacterium]|nr:aquaporin [Pseudomonadota bacterium]
MSRSLLAEYVGSAALAAAVIGSGIMAERLAGGNSAVALLANALATVAMLALLIAALAPVSGAHFNPAVTLAMWIRGALPARRAGQYVIVQIAGCCTGALLSNVMFDLPIVELSVHERAGLAQWLSECIATAGLIAVVLGSPSSAAAAWRVPAWIGAAYWFTSSTSFANPAITVARSLSDTFAGIAPESVLAFVAAQVVGALAATAVDASLTSASVRDPDGQTAEAVNER